MKKLIIAVLLVVGITTFAQGKKEARGERENLTKEQKVDLQVKKLTTDLALNEKQAIAVRSLVEKEVSKREAKREKSSAMKEKKMGDREKMMEERKSEMQKEQAAVAAEMKKILTADQFAKFEKLKAEQKDKMKERFSERKEQKRK